jgi:hypothetical protein
MSLNNIKNMFLLYGTAALPSGREETTPVK